MQPAPAPHKDPRQLLVGLLISDEIHDQLQDAKQSELLSQAGLSETEDLYAPAWKSARNRGFWPALNQIDRSSFRHLVAIEAVVGLISGVVWGGTMALVTLALYHDPAVALVLFVAMVLTLSLAAVAGIMTPALLPRPGFDPANDSSVIVTGITDSMGYFIFPGLATIALTL